jgi:hypothetical protein
MKTIYKEAILPLFLYEAPVWIVALEYEYNRLKYVRVQRLINIRMAKTFRTSSETLCILTGITPIILKAEEMVKKYSSERKRKPNTLFDSEVELKN